MEEARVTGGTEVRALSEIGSETVADESVEVTVETPGPRTEVTGAVMTGTVAEVDETAGLCGQLRDRWPVCSHLKHCCT